MIRVRYGFLAVGFALLLSCESDAVGPDEVLEPGVLASGYRIPDAITVINEDEFLFAERYGGIFLP